MPCRICGNSATVQAHIVPRALYRRVAGDEQHAFQGSRFSTGIRHQAKGLFDPDLLCAVHEAALGPADDYGMRFMDRFETKGRSGIVGTTWIVPNPKPDLLVRFVAGCIWRRGVSEVAREEADLDLGFAEPRLRAMLFEGTTGYRPPLMLCRRTFMSGGEHMRELMWEPSKAQGFGDDAWSFLALGCEFIMKLNPYGLPAFPATLVANGRNPVWAWDREPEELIDVPGIIDIAVNLLRDRAPEDTRDVES